MFANWAFTEEYYLLTSGIELKAMQKYEEALAWSSFGILGLRKSSFCPLSLLICFLISFLICQWLLSSLCESDGMWLGYCKACGKE